MNRLTEWTEDCAIPRQDIRNNGYRRCINKLAYLEDLEEQGKLVNVIRCKDCIRYGDEYVVGAGWCDEHEHLTNDDDYCSYAVDRLAEMEGAENDS